MEKAGTPPTAQRASSAPARRGNAAADFVGRQTELARLDAWLASAAQGEGRLVTVAGEAGIGKTRLLQELLARARRAGAVVLAGRCGEEPWCRAYGPFREALDDYVDEVAVATLRTQLGPRAGVIAQLVPRVRERLPDVAEPERLQPDEERTRLFDAVSQFLIAIATRAPLVLALDDLHWADDDTLALFRYVGHAIARHRMLLLGAYREDEVDAEGSLAQTLALLRRQASCERVALTGLPLADVEMLLQALAQQRAMAWSAGPVEPTLAKAIVDETKGNPFFVRSLVLHLVEEGRLRVEEGRWSTMTPTEDLALPDGVRQVLRRRINRLSGDTQSFLTIAAVVGGTFRFDVVTAVAEWKEEAALAAVDEALQAQLIDPAPGLDSYAFVHGLVRQTLSAALNPSRQVRLHRRIAERMERLYGERAEEHAAEIAQHYHRLPDARGRRARSGLRARGE